MDFEIAMLTKDDVGSFYSVFAHAMKTVFPCYGKRIINFFLEKVYTPVNLIYWLNNDLKYIIAVKENDRFVGFAMIDQPYGGVSFCRWLAVLPSFQKKGIGRKLINQWIKTATSQGCHKVELASHLLANKFYEKVGLTYEGERKLSYFGINQYVYGKVIAKPDETMMIKYY